MLRCSAVDRGPALLRSDQAHQIKRFQAGLERLPEEARITFLESVCHHCPRLEEARISHDQQAVAAIQALVSQPRGAAWICGPSDSARTYLLTAIGNSFAARRPVTGLDIHLPSDFVPVPGVHYPV